MEDVILAETDIERIRSERDPQPLRFPVVRQELPRTINLVRAMLRASPHIIHFKSILDFGKKHAGILPRIPVSSLAPTIAISLNTAS